MIKEIGKTLAYFLFVMTSFMALVYIFDRLVAAIIGLF